MCNKKLPRTEMADLEEKLTSSTGRDAGQWEAVRSSTFEKIRILLNHEKRFLKKLYSSIRLRHFLLFTFIV